MISTSFRGAHTPHQAGVIRKSKLLYRASRFPDVPFTNRRLLRKRRPELTEIVSFLITPHVDIGRHFHRLDWNNQFSICCELKLVTGLRSIPGFLFDELSRACLVFWSDVIVGIVQFASRIEGVGRQNVKFNSHLLNHTINKRQPKSIFVFLFHFRTITSISNRRN